jgi:hypothetical protein
MVREPRFLGSPSRSLVTTLKSSIMKNLQVLMSLTRMLLLSDRITTCMLLQYLGVPQDTGYYILTSLTCNLMAPNRFADSVISKRDLLIS